MPPSSVPIIGIYGIPGCGKSFLLQQLPRQLGQDHYKYWEGSRVISDIVPGGLETFHASTDAEKTHWRQMAINHIRDSSVSTGTPAIVVGHFMFWSEDDDAGQIVCTPADLSVYTHIIYLDTPIATVASRREGDSLRVRPFQSQTHLHRWQQAEKTQLRTLCMENNILFVALRNADCQSVSRLIRSFSRHTWDFNMAMAKARLEDIVHQASLSRGTIKTVLFLDADRTLTPVDSGTLFWQMVGGEGSPCPLKTLFGSPMQYSFAAFRQANLIYEELVYDESEENLNNRCREVSREIQVYPEFINLFRDLVQDKSVLPIVITCGLGQIWKNVLRDTLEPVGVNVIGSEIKSDGIVVTPEVKADLVNYLRQVHGMRVWAIGDSPLDLPMMLNADQAVVVVGRESERSKTMESALDQAIDQKGLRAVQVLVPSNEAVKPRLTTSKLAVVRFTGIDLLDLRVRDLLEINGLGPSIKHATSKAAGKLLMTPTRDASLAGPALREAHRQVGRYLALEFVSEMVGLDSFAIPHVQNRPTEGYRLRYETKTTIVALMRGGDPMAQGVNDIFPLAMFVHAKEPTDLKCHHVAGREAILLVDSVVNSGKSVIEFVDHIRGTLAADIPIVVVAGVAQAGSVTGEGQFAKYLEQDDKLRLVALRLSENKYTGRGGTDTGNRLFNTTHLD